MFKSCKDIGLTGDYIFKDLGDRTGRVSDVFEMSLVQPCGKRR